MERIPVIDISVHNTRRGRIDFQRVYNSGVRGIMIRIGWAGYEGEIVEDESLEDSVIRAAAAGLGVGLYVYSYCTSEQAAKKAAQQAVETARRFVGKITYPIVFDVEETQTAALINLGREELTDTVIAFCEEVQQLGYYAMWYSYPYFIQTHLEADRLQPFDLWIADYSTTVNYDEFYGMWQYIGNGGTCPGVTGPCDRDYAFQDYPAIIRRAGLNDLEDETFEPCADQLKQLQAQLSDFRREVEQLQAQVTELTGRLNQIAALAQV